MVNITIDGKEYEIADGSLILEAVMGVGIHIPTFCYQKRLTPLASCRMCLVEIEGQPKMAPACVTRVADGMVVNTSTPTVSKTRESMLELLLANHPLDCPICDKAGECELQDTVFEYGAGVSSFRDEKRVFRSQDLSLNQVIIFNANRCIQCQRCVRMCEEVVGAVALGTMDRGMDSEITGFENSLSGCDHCGNCIEVCPVGALMSQPYRYTSRPWDLIETDTTCGYCGTGCQLSVGLRDGKLARVRSKYETGINGETLCVKGRFGIDFMDSKDRLTTPMVRKQGELVPVSWEEAMGVLALHVKAYSGQGCFAGLASAGLSCEVLYLFQKMMRTALQTNHIDSSIRWSSPEPIGEKLYDVLPSLMTGFYTRKPIEKILEADCLLVVGSHVTDENPVTDYLIRQSQQLRANRLLLASARPSRLDSLAVATQRLLPGWEAHLFAALEADLTEGITGKSEAVLQTFISTGSGLVKSSSTVSILIGPDILRAPNAGEALQWLQTYAVTLKSLGKQVAIQCLFDRSNQMGAWELGLLPNVLPGWHDITNADHRAYFEKAWQSPLPREEGEDLHGILRRCAAGDMDMLYCVQSDPLTFYPDRALVDHALSKVKMLVVQASHRSPTTECADILLPCAVYTEESGTVLNNEGRLQKRCSIRPPLSNAKENIDIFQGVFEAIGRSPDVRAAEEIFAEMCALVPSLSGMKFTDIKQEGMFPEIKSMSPIRSLQLPPTSLPNAETLIVEPPNSEVAYSGSRDDSTFMLITGECRFHSGGTSFYSETLKELEAEAYVEMNQDIALELGISQGDQVTISNASGEISLPVRLNKHFERRTLFIPENFSDLQLNRLWSKGTYPCPVCLSKFVP
ncbi:NADH-quinone oxidoreductase subunit NuoG [Kiloniella sp.]|uniref:NADH-quinone oxidoreductase subunit NuoG n=1 Tax=Kiloniella sp. TaxID=1938587 RepID=UPI003B015E49